MLIKEYFLQVVGSLRKIEKELRKLVNKDVDFEYLLLNIFDDDEFYYYYCKAGKSRSKLKKFVLLIKKGKGQFVYLDF